MALGLFAEWQPRYADVAVPSFPVVGKKPAIRGYLKVGLAGSRDLASKFSDADAFGIPLSRSRITVLDVDTPDERVLADAMSQCGRSPFIVRSGSGHWQAWYRNSGEGRRIRALPDVDVLGAGYVVAPPSKAAKGAYTIIEGSLDDLPDLPPMGNSLWSKLTTYNCTPSPLPSLPSPLPPELTSAALAGVEPGERNSGLWRYLMAQAPYCDDADALIDVARTAASAFASPLPDDEVVKAALSAWRYEAEDKNWIARGRQHPAPTEPDGLMWESPDAFLLWKVLRFYNAGRARFFIANEMADTMPGGMTRKRLAADRAGDGGRGGGATGAGAGADRPRTRGGRRVMLHGAHLGGLEVRSEGGATRLRGTFPYGRSAAMGAGRSEVIAASAFEVGADLYMLAQHDFDRPLASRAAGTLDVRNGDDALEVTATIPADLRAVSWVADLLAAHSAGLVRGLSPGFRVAPGGERVERRGDGLVRTVTRAELVEISVVTRPAYPEAQVEARNWNPEDRHICRTSHLRRWRA